MLPSPSYLVSRRLLRTVLWLTILSSLFFVSVWPGAAQSPEPPRRADENLPLPEIPYDQTIPVEFKPGEILVKLETGIASAVIDDLLVKHQAVFLRTLYNSDVQVWQVKEGSELSIVEALNAEAAVVYAEPDYRYWALLTPNDPGYGQQWAHPLMGSTSGWDITTGNASIVIAIIDTGIDENHPDLAAKVVSGYDAVDDDNNPHDGHGHGTHVAGIAAAIGNNGVGVAGLDWQARIMGVRVLNNNGSGYTSDIVDGINWAYQHGAKVLNMSLGGPAYSSAMQDAVNAAHASGSLVVAAMGNDSSSTPSYPAAYNNVMAVAATNPSDLRSYYSNYGSHCDIAAPGGEMNYLHDPDGIYSTMPTYWVTMNGLGYSMNYDFLQGTSQATPYVSGLAALIWSVAPTLTPDQVQSTIQSTAVDLGSPGWDQYYGYGRINVQAALSGFGIPATPTLYDISNPDGDGTYLVDWSDVINATSYTLQEDDNPSFSSPIIRYSGSASQFQVTGQSGGPWFYRVRASNIAGDSPWSAFKTTNVAPAAPILNPISNPGALDYYTISWSSVGGAGGYELQEDDNPSFTSPQVRYQGHYVSYSVTGQAGGAWYYRVRAYNVAGNSVWSNSQSTTVNPATLAAPILAPISNSDGDGNYLVNWSDVTNAAGYILEESTTPYFESPTVVYSGAASQYNVSGRTGNNYYYRARATSTLYGNSPWSNTASVTVWSKTVLPAILRLAPSVPPGTGLPISEGFESAIVPPSGWSLVSTNPYYTWEINNFNPVQGIYYANVLYDPGLSPQDEILLSPQFTASNATLSFYSFGSPYWCRDTYDNCDLNVWIVVGAWGGGNDIFVRTVDSDWIGTWTWTFTIINLTPYLPAGTPARIAFQYVGLDGAQIGIDQISISSP